MVTYVKKKGRGSKGNMRGSGKGNYNLKLVDGREFQEKNVFAVVDLCKMRST